VRSQINKKLDSQSKQNNQTHTMSNKFWNSLTGEISQLFEKQEDQTIQKTEETEETTESYKLYSACKTGNEEMINKYIENENDPCEYNTNEYDNEYDFNNSAFIIACKKGFIAVVDRLLQNKWVDPLFNYNTALYRACLYGHIAIVDLLLQDKRINPPTKIYDFYIRNYHKSIIDRLQQEIQNREKVNQ
jgi:ankyrin repeat protein